MFEFINILNAFALLSNFVIVPAISYGSQLALGALGITLIFGILRFANFAHGDLMAFGTMVTILFTWWFQSLGISFTKRTILRPVHTWEWDVYYALE